MKSYLRRSCGPVARCKHDIFQIEKGRFVTWFDFADCLFCCILEVMERNRIKKRSIKTSQIDHHIEVAESRLAAAHSKVLRWAARLSDLKNEQLKLRLEDQLPLGPSTRKNQRRHVAWYSVRDILRDRIQVGGMTTDQLFEAVRRENPRLKLATFRTYLREYSSEQLLQKDDGRWNLAEAVIQSVTQSQKVKTRDSWENDCET